ncbi:hypothetical protein H072_7421 [Dactylellina haptotyla CBS 200.50]|uniref:Methyltransferase CmcJ n=1 Tax=Dactylellina haptotyla (strain CBS 200.50) TaxID=1284197 RepID=S8A790_DACHA|nr:hypothetical protein H072_7421 [Dactylellina haptotyla CBS 200.50]
MSNMDQVEFNADSFSNELLLQQIGQSVENCYDTSHFRSVKADLFFLARHKLWEEEKPFYLNIPVPEGRERTNFRGQIHKVQIHDIRGHENTFKLDECSFQVMQESTPVPFHRIQNIESQYIPSIELFLRDVLNASEVYAFDYTRRTSSPEKIMEQEGNLLRSPGYVVHCGKIEKFPRQQLLTDLGFYLKYSDQTPKAALARLKRHLELGAKAQAPKRIMIVNVWRPIFGPLKDSPLAFCDARTVNGVDLVPSDLIFPGYRGEKFDIMYNDTQKWFYLSDMNENEVLLMKQFDSVKEGVARFCPHAAFKDPRITDVPKPTESIEVRVLVVFDEIN